MTWEWTIQTGELTHDGVLIGTGYAGHGSGVNNPAEQSIPNTGPVPAGRYMIGPAFVHPVCGPVSMQLIPDRSDNEFGRSGFLIHGDNFACNETASDGCIVLDRPVRDVIAAAMDRELIVVP